MKLFGRWTILLILAPALLWLACTNGVLNITQNQFGPGGPGGGGSGPPSLSYAWSPDVLTQGTQMALNQPWVGGSQPMTFAVSPSLPSGLTINPNYGEISGTPSAVTAAQNYTITATNQFGSGSFTLNLVVNLDDSARTWTMLPALSPGVNGPMVVNLRDGRALILGGSTSGGATASTWIYDPSGSSLSTGPSMTAARVGMTATLLNNGKVLVAGGVNLTTLSSAELFDPKNGTFTATGNMTTARTNHTATLLQDGRVLIVGGSDAGTYLSSAEIYDPNSGSFSATGPMSVARSFHAATLLPGSNGVSSVLITGGCMDSPCSVALNSAEIYDSSSGTFSAAAGFMSTGRSRHGAVMLPNGQVLVISGATTGTGATTGQADVYDPNTRTFSGTNSVTSSRSDFTSILLPNGKVLIAGGNSGSGCSPVSAAELYDPSTTTWSPTAAMPYAVTGQGAALLMNGWVLVAGGEDNTCTPLTNMSSYQ